MFGGKSIMGIIPARYGSKRLPRKNVLPLGNKPLIAWTIEAAKKSEYIDRTYVSTESKIIKNIALKYAHRCNRKKIICTSYWSKR